jgi:hypothetical protein
LSEAHEPMRVAIGALFRPMRTIKIAHEIFYSWNSRYE